MAVGLWLSRQTLSVIKSRFEVSAAPAGYRFPREVIAVAVRWYLRYGLSYRDVEELLAERGVTVDHVTDLPVGADLHRRVHRRCTGMPGSVPGGRWFVDETYAKVGGRWSYLYRAIDQHGQVIDVLGFYAPQRRRGAGVLQPGAEAMRWRRSRSPLTRHRSTRA